VKKAFNRICEVQLAELNLRSNMGKVKVINPLGGTASIPPALLEVEAQGGELQGFKCVGAFVAPATEAGDAWRVAQLKAMLSKRLKPLDRVNILELARKKDGKNNFSKLRFDLIQKLRARQAVLLHALHAACPRTLHSPPWMPP
jgi:hypothetical protein